MSEQSEQVVLDPVGVAFLVNKLERRVIELEAQVKSLATALQVWSEKPIGPWVPESKLPPQPAPHAAPVEPPVEHGRGHRHQAKRGHEE